MERNLDHLRDEQNPHRAEPVGDDPAIGDAGDEDQEGAAIGDGSGVIATAVNALRIRPG